MAVALLIALAGCSSLRPYGYAYLQHPLESETDYWLQPARDWQCGGPWVNLGAGIEHRTGVRVGLHHYSTLRCGGHNDKAEVYYNAIEVGGDWGGWK